MLTECTVVAILLCGLPVVAARPGDGGEGREPEVVGIAGGVVGTAGVHAPGYLLPDDFTVKPGVGVRLSWQRGGGEGEGETREPWPAGVMTHAMVRALGEQVNFDSIGSADGTIAEISADAVGSMGVMMVGVTLEDKAVAPGAGDLARVPLPTARTVPGTSVRLVRCATALVRRDDDETRGAPSAVATSKAGLPAEIRPMMDPTTARIGSDIPLRVFAGSTGRPGAVMRARLISPAAGDGAAAAVGVVQTIVANDAAIGTMNVTHAGVWVVEYETLMESRPPDSDPEATMVTWYQATLTFEVPAP